MPRIQQWDAASGSWANFIVAAGNSERFKLAELWNRERSQFKTLFVEGKGVDIIPEKKELPRPGVPKAVSKVLNNLQGPTKDEILDFARTSLKAVFDKQMTELLKRRNAELEKPEGDLLALSNQMDGARTLLLRTLNMGLGAWLVESQTGKKIAESMKTMPTAKDVVLEMKTNVSRYIATEVQTPAARLLTHSMEKLAADLDGLFKDVDPNAFLLGQTGNFEMASRLGRHAFVDKTVSEAVEWYDKLSLGTPKRAQPLN